MHSEVMGVGLITVDYRDRKLIYEQLVDNVKDLILRGDLKRDEFLPSVRSLARELGINPNTIQKAYTELERQGVIATLSGRGSIVIFDKDSMAQSATDDLREEFLPLIARARTLGMTKEAFLKIAGECWQASDAAREPNGGDSHDQN